MWEVERVYIYEKDSYWWTKPQLKLIRDEYKDEVMMEGVRNLVKARVQQEETDPEKIEDRVEEVMKLDHGKIANFLQSVPTKSEQLSSSYTPKLVSSDDSDSDSDTDSDSDSESSESSVEKEDHMQDDPAVESQTGLDTTSPKPEPSSTNDNDNDKNQDEDDSDDEEDDDDDSSSSSSSVDEDESQPIESQTPQPEDDEKNETTEIRSDHERKYRKAGKSRLRQGVLAVVAIDRLKKLVKKRSPPPTSIDKVLASSSRLMDMYLPSDDELDDDIDSSDENDSDDDSISDCPVCLDLVNPSQKRKVILLRRMLCKDCYFAHYINREDKDGTDTSKNKSFTKRSGEDIRGKNGRLNFDNKRDVQILSSMKRCISNTEKTPMMPELPMERLKSPLLRDNFFIKSDQKTKAGYKPAR